MMVVEDDDVAVDAHEKAKCGPREFELRHFKHSILLYSVNWITSTG